METVSYSFILYLSFGILLLALVLTLIRLIRGPGTGNMIVALDLTASIVMGYILVYAVISGKTIYIDVAIVISLISFMGTIALSNYLKDKR